MDVRQRKQIQAPFSPETKQDSARPVSEEMSGIMDILRRQPVWIILAVSSGACAALNGVFAKLYVSLFSRHAGVTLLLTQL